MVKLRVILGGAFKNFEAVQHLKGFFCARKVKSHGELCFIQPQKRYTQRGRLLMNDGLLCYDIE